MKRKLARRQFLGSHPFIRSLWTFLFISLLLSCQVQAAATFIAPALPSDSASIASNAAAIALDDFRDEQKLFDELTTIAQGNFVGAPWVAFDIEAVGKREPIGIDSLRLAIDAESIPEPAMFLLMGLALLGCMWLQRRPSATRIEK